MIDLLTHSLTHSNNTTNTGTARAHDELVLEASKRDAVETVIEAAAPERALTEVWRVAMSLKKELRMQIHMRKTREGERSVLSESTQIEKAIKRANYLRSMFETLTEKNTSTSSNWRDVLERLRSSKKSTSTTKSLSSETRRILRAVKDFVVAETPTLELSLIHI